MWRSKKMELASEVGISLNKTKFSKTITKNDTFFSRKLISMLMETGKIERMRFIELYKVLVNFLKIFSHFLMYM